MPLCVVRVAEGWVALFGVKGRLLKVNGTADRGSAIYTRLSAQVCRGKLRMERMECGG